MQIRRAVLTDAHALAPLSGELGYPVDPNDMEKRLAIALAADSGAVFVAELVGKVVGWTHVVVLASLEYGTRAELYGLVVAEGYRGQGIGKALMQASEAWARQRGLPTLRLRTNMIRADAHAFYERIGYRRVKEQRVYEKTL